ncbi:transporter [Bremerella sp.]|uniref:transporter n=1 Tax=Bremerella sp. TaxID=2795602 RepID=UPI00391CFFAC
MTSPRDTRRTKNTAAKRLGSAVTCLFAAVGSLTQVNLMHAAEPGQQAFRLDQPIYVAEPVESPPKKIFNEHNQPHFRLDQPMFVAKSGQDQAPPLFGSHEPTAVRRDSHRPLIQPVKNVLRKENGQPTKAETRLDRPAEPGPVVVTVPTVNVPNASEQVAQSLSPASEPGESKVAANTNTDEPSHPQFRIDQPMYTAQSTSQSTAPPLFSEKSKAAIQKKRWQDLVESLKTRSASESLDQPLPESRFAQSPATPATESSQAPEFTPAAPVPPFAQQVNQAITQSDAPATTVQVPVQPQQPMEQPLVSAEPVEKAPTPDWTQQLRQIYGDDTPIYVGYLVDNGTFQESIIAQTSLQQAEPVVPAVPQLSQGSSSSNSASQSETYGEEPQDFNIQFLRTASVLLKQGDWQFDYGIAYAKDDYDFPITLTPSGVARANLKRRTIQVPFAVRYGLTDRLQLSAGLPVGWSNAEFSSLGLFDQSDSQTGIGDLELGLNYHWKYGQYQCTPDVILSFGLTVPTGDGQFPTTGISQAALANDVWAPSVQMLFINRYDPIVCFYGIGYRYQFEGEFDGVDVQYGQQFSYNFGVGFAVNDRITLSTAFLGLYQTETEVNGLGLPGSIYEPLRLRFAVTSYRCGRIVEPYAEIGLTNDAADAIIGITWTL